MNATCSFRRKANAPEKDSTCTGFKRMANACGNDRSHLPGKYRDLAQAVEYGVYVVCGRTLRCGKIDFKSNCSAVELGELI